MRVCGLAAVGALFARDPARVERLFFLPRLRGAVSKFCAALAQARKPYREIEAAEPTRVAGTRTIGIVRCDQPRALDLDGRRARRLEAVPDTIVDEVLARLAPLFQ